MSHILIKESNYAKFIKSIPNGWNYGLGIYTRTHAHTGTVIVTTISCSPQVGSTIKKQGYMVINNTTMKFHEILTKAKSDISKILNFTRKPLFP